MFKQGKISSKFQVMKDRFVQQNLQQKKKKSEADVIVKPNKISK